MWRTAQRQRRLGVLADLVAAERVWRTGPRHSRARIRATTTPPVKHDGEPPDATLTALAVPRGYARDKSREARRETRPSPSSAAILAVEGDRRQACESSI